MSHEAEWDALYHMAMAELKERAEKAGALVKELTEALRAIDAIIPITAPHTIRVPHSVMAQIRNALARAEATPVPGKADARRDG